jgi:VanZ family protein
MYAVLAFLCWRALAARLSVRRRVLCVVAGASLFGALDEVHQRFIPGRTADPRDWTADTLGAALGAGAALRALTRRDASSQNTE